MASLGWTLRVCMSNSFTSVVVLWVVSRYFGEVIAMSLESDTDDGARPVIIQTEGVHRGVSGGMVCLPGGSSGVVHETVLLV